MEVPRLLFPETGMILGIFEQFNIIEQQRNRATMPLPLYQELEWHASYNMEDLY